MNSDTITKHFIPALFALAAPLALAAGCADEPIADGEAAAPEAVEQDASHASLKIEQAERMLERGVDFEQAQALLEAAIAEPDITPEERSTAILALSRASEALGDSERAVSLVEAEIAAHRDDKDWPTRPFARRLRKLLTGSETAPGAVPDEDKPTPPFARMLSSHFSPGEDGRVTVNMFIAGGDSGLSNRLGTFNIGASMRAELEEACPLCDRNLDVRRSIWRSSDWLMIPEARSKFDGAMTVFYFDLYKNRIPARYESYLPMPVADIVAELQEGKSFAMAKERAGSPPSLLIAAPRVVMFEEVEEKLALLTELPTEPVYFDAHQRLMPNEIRAVVRGQWLGKVRGCYDSLRQSAPDAEGRIIAHMKIAPDGSLSKGEVTTEAAALDDATFLECLTSSLNKITFPKTDGVVTVKYPMMFTKD